MAIRKATPHVPPPVADEEIDPDLLDQIPDVVAPAPAVRPARPFTIRAPPMMPAPPPPEPEAPASLRQLLDALQQEMEGVLAQEMTRIEHSVAGMFAEMEQRLAEANAAVEDLRNENAQLVHAKDKYDRAFAALKDLTRDVEEAP